MTWTITTNTDAVDIEQKCLGLSPRRKTIPRDVWGHIATNRGLHIQIRHNGDSQTFGQASELSRLISAAPEMLEALKQAMKVFPEQMRGSMVEAAIKRAEGK